MATTPDAHVMVSSRFAMTVLAAVAGVVVCAGSHSAAAEANREAAPVVAGRVELGRREQQLWDLSLAHERADKPDEAVVYLQRLLDLGTDAFFDYDGAETTLRRAIRARLAAAGSPLRDAYELRYADTAAAALKQALTEADPEAVATVARTYPTTSAGLDARALLATRRFDSGEWLGAARQFETLLADDPVAGNNQRLAQLLRRLAVCYSRLGDSARLADSQNRLRQLGTAAVSDDPMAAERSPVPVREADPTVGPQWSVAPLLDPFAGSGATSTPLHGAVRLQWAALRETVGGEPHAARPLVCENRVVLRTAATLTAHDRETGKLLWRALPESPWWQVRSDSQELPTAVKQLLANRAYADGAWTRLTTDGANVWAVESVALAVGENADFGGWSPAISGGNQLVGYDLATGRRTAELGGPNQPGTVLPGVRVLGPPLAHRGSLFVLVEEGGQVSLVTFRWRREGVTVESTQPLWTVDASSVTRASGSALSPVLAGGLLLCPLPGGRVFAVDPADRELCWARSPWSDPVEPSDRYGNGPRILPAPNVPGRPGFGFPGGWPGGTMTPGGEVAVAAGGGTCVVLNTRADAVAAIDALSGELSWTAAVPDARGLLDCDRDAVVLQTGRGATCFGLRGGNVNWTSPLADSGDGVALGDRLLVPTKADGVVILDRDSGRRLGTIPLPAGEHGRLAAEAGTIVFQSDTHLARLPRPELEPDSR